MARFDLSKSGIYNIINTVALKQYIGSAKCFSDRWAGHRSTLRKGTHTNSHLQRSWNKYGCDAFEFGVIEYVDDPQSLTDIEQMYLDSYWGSGTLYNLSPTAGNSLGTKHTDEARRKISQSKLGHTPWNKGVTHSPQTRAKISKKAMGRTVWNKGIKGAQTGWNKGKKLPSPSEETLLKMSASHKGRKMKPEIGKATTERQSALWLVTFPDNHTEEITNLERFCNSHSLASSALSHRGHTKGYRAIKICDGQRAYIHNKVTPAKDTGTTE